MYASVNYSYVCILMHIIMHIAMEHTSTAYMHTFYNRKMSWIVGAHTCISAYDKDQKLSEHLFLTNSMKFPLIMYSKFVWPSLIWPDRCLFWPENVWWLATADIETSRLLASSYVGTEFLQGQQYQIRWVNETL